MDQTISNLSDISQSGYFSFAKIFKLKFLLTYETGAFMSLIFSFVLCFPDKHAEQYKLNTYESNTITLTHILIKLDDLPTNKLLDPPDIAIGSRSDKVSENAGSLI